MGVELKLWRPSKDGGLQKTIKRRRPSDACSKGEVECGRRQRRLPRAYRGVDILEVLYLHSFLRNGLTECRRSSACNVHAVPSNIYIIQALGNQVSLSSPISLSFTPVSLLSRRLLDATTFSISRFLIYFMTLRLTLLFFLISLFLNMPALISPTASYFHPYHQGTDSYWPTSSPYSHYTYTYAQSSCWTPERT